jgi:parallel beta-helix repeat protein
MKMCKSDCCTVSPATFVVAASDSLHKKRADYVCDGVDDHVEIQAAIDALPSQGGVIFFRAGIYTISSTLNVTKQGVHFRGEGGRHGGSIIFLADEANCNMIDVAAYNFEIMQMELIGNGNNQSAESIHGIYGHPEGALESLDLRVILTYIFGCKNAAVYTEGRYPYFINSTFEYSMFGIFTKSRAAHIIGCWNYKCDVGIKAVGNDYNLITGYHTVQDGLPGSYGIVLEDSNYNNISACNFVEPGRGIVLEHSSYNTLQGLQIHNAQKEAIDFRGSTTNVLTGSTLRCASQAAANTYNSINLKSLDSVHSKYNLFVGNIISSIPPNGAKYGISEEDANQNNNVISRNVFSGATTGEIHVLGSETIVDGNPGHVTKNSGNSTGTGAQQTIAHGLVAAPTKAILWNIENGANAYQSASADATNIYITAVINLDYGWEAEVV